MTLQAILDTIIDDWALLMFMFTVGGIWWQGKAWFKKIDTALNHESSEHRDQNSMLQTIHDKVDNLEARITKIEETVTRIHEEQHEQEVKLAILETAQEPRQARRKASRT